MSFYLCLNRTNSIKYYILDDPNPSLYLQMLLLHDDSLLLTFHWSDWGVYEYAHNFEKWNLGFEFGTAESEAHFICELKWLLIAIMEMESQLKCKSYENCPTANHVAKVNLGKKSLISRWSCLMEANVLGAVSRDFLLVNSIFCRYFQVLYFIM